MRAFVFMLALSGCYPWRDGPAWVRAEWAYHDPCRDPCERALGGGTIYRRDGRNCTCQHDDVDVTDGARFASAMLRLPSVEDVAHDVALAGLLDLGRHMRWREALPLTGDPARAELTPEWRDAREAVTRLRQALAARSACPTLREAVRDARLALALLDHRPRSGYLPECE